MNFIIQNSGYKLLVKILTFKGSLGFFNPEFRLTGKLRATYNFLCSKYKICNYLFFDSCHPTALLHKVAGDTLFDLIVTNNDL